MHEPRRSSRGVRLGKVDAIGGCPFFGRRQKRGFRAGDIGMIGGLFILIDRSMPSVFSVGRRLEMLCA
ncbi:MAG: hypothetical protein CO108_05820 [Deltaproteobacteria bacterium CG_4_9_14_3_um_filter_63_12]|nr:MAG: hypothetical protein CO108_05820 [Deltaproteobacteria bacterium CG_4_9_14_3_um_filter_63_12]